MIRQGLGLIFASMAIHTASAGDILAPGQADKAVVANHCSALGEGFFGVAGSNACIKISGRISAGAGLGTGAVNSFGPRISGNPGNQAFAAEAAAGDLRFDNLAGPARVYVGVEKGTSPRWVIDGQ